jgi:hypothetical protein
MSPHSHLSFLRRAKIWCGGHKLSIIAGFSLIGLFVFLRYLKDLKIEWIAFDGKIESVALVTTVILIFTVFQLEGALCLQRAGFIKEYASRIFTDPELRSAFHELVYRYNNEIFSEIDKIARSKTENIDLLPTALTVGGEFKPIFFEVPEQFKNRSKKGARYYHPALFQRSKEEERLDALLSYLNVIGYYYHEGLLKMSDITGTLAFILIIIKERNVIARYIEICQNGWTQYTHDHTLGLPQPLSHLQNLLNHFEMYARKNSRRIARELT